MKRVKVSNNVIRRLPRYLRRLDELTDEGVSPCRFSGKTVKLSPLVIPSEAEGSDSLDV